MISVERQSAEIVSRRDGNRDSYFSRVLIRDVASPNTFHKQWYFSLLKRNKISAGFYRGMRQKSVFIKGGNQKPEGNNGKTYKW